jgi:hypothetical protein
VLSLTPPIVGPFQVPSSFSRGGPFGHDGFGRKLQLRECTDGLGLQTLNSRAEGRIASNRVDEQIYSLGSNILNDIYRLPREQHD